jgi:hypothetical protein
VRVFLSTIEYLLMSATFNNRKDIYFIRYSQDMLTISRYIFTNRDNDQRSSDMRDLVTSFSALEEKVLEQYTFAKVLC